MFVKGLKNLKMHPFTEISILVALAAAVSVVMRALKQPLIIGNILTGLIVGPSLLGLVKSPDTVGLLGEFGIALLLFVVGLGLNPKVVKEVGKVSLFTGLGQIFFTIVFALILSSVLGYSSVESIFIAIALAFSSTIIILKLLSDKKEQNKLYGKISIGFLLVQDIVATFVLVGVAAMGVSGFNVGTLGELAIKGIVLVAAILLFTYYVIRPVNNFLSKSQELLFLFSIAWGFGIGALFYELGFSLEVGALFAGVALASFPYAQEIGSRLKPLRDFFLVVFFIALGSRLSLDNFQEHLAPALAFSALVLIGNPIIVMSIMGFLGYTKKTSFKAGLAVAQISEFSLILLLLAQNNQQISSDIVLLITIVAVITIAASAYMITYSDKLYGFLENYLRLFERRKIKHAHESQNLYEAVLFGYKRGGHEFVKAFQKITNKYIVVDYDPEIIDQLERKQIPYLYGDATDAGLLEEINLAKTRLVVSSLNDFETTKLLTELLEKHNPNVVSVVHADNLDEAVELYQLGASYVMLPQYIGTEKISAFIKKHGFSKSDFKQFREQHLTHLQNRYDSKLEPEET